jgi:hypothetical protein
VSVTNTSYNGLINQNWRPFISDQFIIEDFPMSQIEFETRFNSGKACIDYLAKMKWIDGFHWKRCGHNAYCSVAGTYFTPVAKLLIY